MVAGCSNVEACSGPSRCARGDDVAVTDAPWGARSNDVAAAARRGTPGSENLIRALEASTDGGSAAGVAGERIPPATPSANGRQERFHRTLKQHTANPPAANRRAQQRAFRLFCREYNEERPHQALGQQVPASIYRPSDRVYPSSCLRSSIQRAFCAARWAPAARSTGAARGSSSVRCCRANRSGWRRSRTASIASGSPRCSWAGSTSAAKSSRRCPDHPASGAPGSSLHGGQTPPDDRTAGHASCCPGSASAGVARYRRPAGAHSANPAAGARNAAYPAAAAREPAQAAFAASGAHLPQEAALADQTTREQQTSRLGRDWHLRVQQPLLQSNPVSSRRQVDFRTFRTFQRRLAEAERL